MGYPLIILGAGASYDFQDLREYGRSEISALQPWQPPLTDQLFDGTRFQELLNKYSAMDQLVSDIRGKLRRGRGGSDSTFEKILTKIFENDVKNDPDLYESFMALLFYIADVFTNITKSYYRQHNNYAALQRKLKQGGGKAIFVNFNYDLLFEKALGREDMKEVDEYINDSSYPIIKIHGACNWFWRRHINLFDVKPSYDLSLMVAEGLFKGPEGREDKWERKIILNVDPKTLMAQQLTHHSSGYSYHPNLALPIIEKSEFACPDSHIELLKERLGDIDRIIIIGWKIGDIFLRDLITEELGKRNIPIAFVGGSNAHEAIASAGDKIKSNTVLTNQVGFSDFISSDEAESFLA